MGLNILGAGYYVPEFSVSNEDYQKIVETSDEWITTRTGIKTRHITTNDLTFQMGAKAATMALKDANLEAGDIDMVIATTVTPDTLTPSLACLVASEIGVENAPCFDINVACSAFVYALDMANLYLASGQYKNILIVSAEMLSRMTDYTDRGTCVLFGDAAGACIVSKGEGMFSSFLGSSPAGASKIFTKLKTSNNPFTETAFDWGNETMNEAPDNLMFMAGNDVYKFATTVMPEACEKACEKAGMTTADLDLIIPHQANIRIVQTAIKRLKLPLDKFYVNIQDFGNTSSACIPLALAQLRKDNKLQKGQKICVVGFGAGLTYGAAVFEL